MGHLKRDFVDSYLTSFFLFRNFGNTSAMRVICFSKGSTINVDLKNAHKNSEKLFCFSDEIIWIVCIELSLLRRVYLSSLVNYVTKSLKTLHLPNSDFFQLNFFLSNQWIWERCWRWEWISFSARWPCFVWRGHLKRVFLGIYLTTFFGVRNFRNS